jgi:salicylate hydroxylase
MHVALAGAGIGGLTAALALPEFARITLLEQAGALREAGAGIQLSPNATRVLIRLGLGDALTAIAFEPQAAEVRDAATGRLLLSQPLGADARYRWGAPYLHVHRADLQDLLLWAVESRGRVKLNLRSKVAGVEQTDKAVTAVLEGGSRLKADALIGCDGLHSKVRSSLWGAESSRFTGQTAWRGTVRTSNLPAGLIPPVAAVWTGPGRHFVHYYVRGGARVNFVGVVERRTWTGESWTEPGDPDQLAADFAGWPREVQAVIGAADEVWRWALFDRPPLPTWTKGRATLLGDAAHPMLPFLAQGAAMAIEDAAALGEALRLEPRIEPALAAYEAARRDRTARVQAASRRNAALFHLPPVLSRLTFGAAAALKGFDDSNGAGRFDWLYGG